MDSFICKHPDNPEFIAAARGGFLPQGKMASSAACWPYYHLRECSWRSLLVSRIYTEAEALVRYFYIDRCIYRAHNAQHKHHIPPSPHSPTCTHMHTPTRDSALGHGAAERAHPAASIQKASSGSTILSQTRYGDKPLPTLSHSKQLQMVTAWARHFPYQSKTGGKGIPASCCTPAASWPSQSGWTAWEQKATTGQAALVAPVFTACTSTAMFSHSPFQPYITFKSPRC